MKRSPSNPDRSQPEAGRRRFIRVHAILILCMLAEGFAGPVSTSAQTPAPAVAQDNASPQAPGEDIPPLPDQPAISAPIDKNDIGNLLDRRTEAAIKRGLENLKATQAANGMWSEDSNAVANTALAMISFMLNGYFPCDKQPYGPTMKKALDSLLKEEKAGNGYMGTSMYAHGLATLALSEVWGQTDRDDEVQEALKAGVGIILRSQAPIGGWRYAPVPGSADVSVTAMQLVALSGARQAGILVPNQTIDGAVRYINLCRDEPTGGFYYTAGRGSPAFARSAAAVFSLMMCGRHESNEVKSGIHYLEALPPVKFTNTDYYAYAHYYAALAMSMAGEDHFRAWYPQIRDVLLTRQTREGGWGYKSSYSTAMSLIVLSIPYCYVPAYQR